MEDWQLLRRFVDAGSEAAFARLMERHRGLVYSTCRRELGDSALAEDATQVVFLVLAQKAKSLRRGVVLSGWLFQTARFAARDLRKSEGRRRVRDEGMGIEMHRTAAREQEAAWRQIDPRLHDSLDRLGAKDRDAILLRFFEDNGFAEVGLALGQTEDAARHRVSRALEKMRRFLASQGVAVPAAALGALLAAHALEPAAASADVSTVPHFGPRVYHLTQGVLKAMWMKQMSGLAALVIGLAALGAGAGLVRALAPNTPPPHVAPAVGAGTRRLPPDARPQAAASTPANAPSTPQTRRHPISEIRITGNKVVPTAAILAAFDIKGGETVSDAQIMRALTHVYNLAWFQMVGPFQLERKADGGFLLTLPVQENAGLAGTKPEEFQEQAEIAAAYNAGEDALHDHQPDRFKAMFTPNFRAVDKSGRRATLEDYLAQIDGPLGPQALIEFDHHVTDLHHSGNLMVVSATLTWYRWLRLPGSPDTGCEEQEQRVEDDWHQSQAGWVLETRKATADIKTRSAPESYLRMLRSRAARGLPY